MSLLAIGRGRIVLQRLRRLAKEEDAIAITEYGMLVAFLCMAIIAVVYIFGTQIAAWFSSKAGSITTV